jgi:hypothetical protein
LPVGDAAWRGGGGVVGVGAADAAFFGACVVVHCGGLVLILIVVFTGVFMGCGSIFCLEEIV